MWDHENIIVESDATDVIQVVYRKTQTLNLSCAASDRSPGRFCIAKDQTQFQAASDAIDWPRDPKRRNWITSDPWEHPPRIIVIVDGRPVISFVKWNRYEQVVL